MLIRVNDLKTCLNKVMCAVSNDKQLPITSLLGIYVSKEEKLLELKTYDGINVTSTYKLLALVDDDLEAVVNAELFNTLINKIEWDSVELERDDNSLKIKFGRNSYKLDIAYEEDGMVQFPNIIDGIDLDSEHIEKGLVSSDDLKEIKNTNGSCLSNNKSLESYLLGAYCGESIITTDNVVACFSKIKLFNGVEVLIHPKTINLLKNFSGDVMYWIFDNKLCLSCEDYDLCAYLMEEVVDFPVKALNDLLDIAIDGNFSINVAKSDLVNAISRLKLFISDIDSDTLEFNYYGDKIVIKGVDNDSIEEIALSGNPQEKVEFYVSCNILLTQLKSLKNNVVEIFYNSKNFICLNDAIGVKVIATESVE